MPNTAKVFVTRQIAPQAVAKLKEYAEVEIWPQDSPPPYDILLARAGDVDGLLTLLTDRIDDGVIQAGSARLRVISQMAVGFDNIDISSAIRNGIPVGHTPGVLTEATADFTFTLLLAAARRVVEADEEVRAGIWRPWGPDVLVGREVSHATLGIIGMGRIGQAVARRGRGFEMKILYHDLQRKPEVEKELGIIYVSLEDLFSQSDFICVHTFLSPETNHLINQQAFEQMKPSAILINTARGGIVDSQALIDALQQGKIVGAGLDVFDPEPIPSNSPLLKMKNVVIAPHIASASGYTRLKMAQVAVDNLIAGLNRQPLPYCANPQVYGMTRKLDPGGR